MRKILKIFNEEESICKELVDACSFLLCEQELLGEEYLTALREMLDLKKAKSFSRRIRKLKRCAKKRLSTANSELCERRRKEVLALVDCYEEIDCKKLGFLRCCLAREQEIFVELAAMDPDVVKTSLERCGFDCYASARAIFAEGQYGCLADMSVEKIFDSMLDELVACEGALAELVSVVVRYAKVHAVTMRTALAICNDIKAVV